MPENVVLVSNGRVSLGLSHCGAVPGDRIDEEVEAQFTLVFPLSGVFGVETDGGKFTATPAKAVLFNRGQERHIRHPGGGHDESAYISMGAGFAEPFLDDLGRFRVEVRPTTTRHDYLLRLLITAARFGHPDLELEEFTVGVLGELTGAVEPVEAEGRHGVVDDAEEYLSAHFHERCDLATVARHVGCSHHHLSRLFKQLTGESLSRRRMRLRLASAMSQILGGADDLSRVAVESGFYDHSHMTNSFRAHFGAMPSEVRSATTGDLLPEVWGSDPPRPADRCS